MKYNGLSIEAMIVEDPSMEMGYAVIPCKKGTHVWGEDYILSCKRGGEMKYFVIGVKPVTKRGIAVDGTNRAIAVFRAFTRWAPVPYEILDCKVVGGKGGELR